MWPVLGALVLGFAAGAGLGAAAALRRRSRVRVLREGAGELARGNLAHRIILPADDEVGHAAENINALADAMQQEREVANARHAAQQRLLANVSHDLRTPITSIAGYVDALQRGLGNDPERYLSIIAAKTDELAQLTDDLFYEARLDAGDLSLDADKLDLAEAVRLAVLGFEPQLVSLGVHVLVDLPQTTCMVEADASAVARVLGNLISNALRHGSGMTLFSVVMTDGEGGYILEITNDGARSLPDVERIFERGVAGAGGGAGLGLAIARDLAARMGATVTAGSSAEGVLTFVLAFPKAAE